MLRSGAEGMASVRQKEGRKSRSEGCAKGEAGIVYFARK